LRQLLSLGVPRRALVIGKALGATAGLALVVVPATLLGVVALAYSAEFGGLFDDVPRATLLMGAYLLYFASFIAVSLGVSARARSSRTALVVLLAFWFVNSLIVARAASDLAGWLHPSPSAIEFQQAMQEELSDTEALQARLERLRQELMQRHNVTSIDAVPINFSGISLQEGEEHANEVFDRHYGRLFDIYGAQNRVVQWAGLAAPMLPMRSLSMALAGTDFMHHRDFVIAAETYRRDIQRVMNGDIARNSRPGVAYVANSDLWAKVPEFTYDLPRASWALRQTAPSLMLLLAWVAGTVWFASRATRVLAAD
jgi:ABC-2 type transport system permease protein